MLNLVKYSLIPITLIGILGCGGGSSSDSGVDVIVERGPVYAAIVKDADGQIAKDNQTNVYTFKTQPKYPITASPSKNSFIDVDADAKPSEGDTYFKEPLRSCTNEITSISNYIYTQTKCDKQKMDQAYKTLSSSLNADENELKKVPTQMKSVKAIVAANAIYSLTNEESAFILPGKVINLDKGDITLERIKKKAEQIEIYIGTLTDPSKIEAMVLKEDKIPTFNQATADNIKKNITTKPAPTPETKPKPTPGTTPAPTPGTTSTINSKVLKTGQTKCYDFDTNKEETCTEKHKGQDGYYQAGIARSYTKGTDVVKDNATGLMWQDNADVADESKKKSWQDAKTYCKNLSLAGYSYWRLPTIKELESIVDYSRHKGSGMLGAIDEAFGNVKNFYWSNATNASNSGNAWAVSFDNGSDFWSSKSNSFLVRCVR